MLVAMKKIDKELFDDLHNQFVQLDPTGDGQITKSDLVIMAERKMKTMRHKMELSEYKVSFFRLGHHMCLFKGVDSSSLFVLKINRKYIDRTQ